MAPVRAYVATSRSGTDLEMRERVRRHRADRGEGWITIEPESVSPNGPLNAVAALERAAAEAGVVLFDCVTLWLADRLWRESGSAGEFDDDHIVREADALAAFLICCPVPVALVTNEVGWGLVPDYPLGRRFRDMAGLVNQRLGDACQGVVLAVCGQPLVIKGGFELLQPEAK